MIFRNSRRIKEQESKRRNARRKRLSRWMARSPHVEALEDRRLLAVVGYDTEAETVTFTADADEQDNVQISGSQNELVIQVGNGDQIALADDALANADFVLSTTTTANDTLTISLDGLSVVTSLGVNTLDESDSIIVGDLSGVGELTDVSLDGGLDADTFSLVPSTGVAIDVDGGEPVGGLGDALTVDVANVTGTTLAITNVGEGFYSFTSTQSDISFTGIESPDVANGTAAIAFDLSGDATVSRAGGNFVIEQDSTTVLSLPLTSIRNVAIIGDDGDNSLTIDYSNDDPIPAGGLTFAGGTQETATGDSLSLIGDFTRQVFTYTTTTPGEGNNGNIDIDGGGLITYTGLEPITGGNSDLTVLVLPDLNSNDAILQNSATDGFIELIDNGATFEDTVFPNPTTELRVELGDSGDELLVNTLDDNFAASLVIAGGTNDDTVELVNVDLINTPGRGLTVSGTEMLDISGGEISGNTATRGGGILIDSSNTVATIDGVTISGNTATGDGTADGGGGIYNVGADLTIANSDIVQNVANGALGSGGGIFNANGSTLEIVDSAVSENEATQSGGGIQDASNGTVTLNNVNLDENEAIGSNSVIGRGGGIDVMGIGTVSITGGTITGNSAAVLGGGVAGGRGTTVNIDGTLVSENVATGAASGLAGGAGIFNEGTLDVDNATITGNITDASALGQGGGGILNQGIATIDATEISLNTASIGLADGGGILNTGPNADLTITGGSIDGNAAARAGGGIENNAPSLDLLNVTLSNNVAGVNGGGLHISGNGDISVTGGEVTSNVAEQEGGGLWNSSSATLLITEVLVQANFANGTEIDRSGGGGVFNDGGLVEILDSEITGNTALGDGPGEGGGGIFNDGLLTLTDSDVTLNLAVNGLGNGGGILNSDGGTLTVTGGTIADNSAARAGGGIENDSGIVRLEDAELIGNVADINGGGLHTSGTGQVNVNLGTVADNSAGQEGGGLWNSAGGSLTVDGTTISGNTASGAESDQGGGGIFNAGGTVQVDNATISMNTADGAAGSGGGILNDASGEVFITATEISQNQSNRAGGGIETTAGTRTDLLNVDLLENNTGIAPATAAPGNGGGLHVTGDGTVNVISSTVSGNIAAREGGGLWNDKGTMTIRDTDILGNTASGPAADDGGGGIFNNGGIVQINNSLINANSADGTAGSGGGILNFASGQLFIAETEISQNQSNRAGGGIETTAGTLTDLFDVDLLQNNTGIAPATAAPGNGGGLHVTGDGTVNVISSTVNGNIAAREGGGLWNDDGIMTIRDTDIIGNTASGPAADDGGGGIFNNGGGVDIARVVIAENVADGERGSGGGIFNNEGGVIDIVLSGIFNNVSTRAGGGIEDLDGQLISIVDSTISGNNAGTSPGNGGGIHITSTEDAEDGSGTVDIDGTTIEGNTAVEGGGLWNSAGGNFLVTNSTISGNTATGSDGGGIFNTSEGFIDLDSVTITLNETTASGGGIAGGNIGVQIKNTIVAQNRGPNGEQNLSGTISSEDFNVIGDRDEGTLVGFTVNTIFGAEALLLPLGNNGGPTRTHLPTPGSPAIGFGDTDLAVDQRNEDRPEGGRDDVGAVEVTLNGFVVDAGLGNLSDGNPDEFLVKYDGPGLDADLIVEVNSVEVFREPRATTGLLLIRGSADDDTLTIDNSNGLIGTNLIFDGDGVSGTRGGADGLSIFGGFDTLRLIGDTPVTTTYNPGETADAGAVFQENEEVLQRVEFFGLEPLQVLAPAGGNNVLNIASAPLGIGFPQALNESNTINYTEGPNSDDPVDPVFAGARTGLITVDGFESLEFANFEVLNIDAGPGSDSINLANEFVPAELGTINVDAGDPNAGSDDTLVVQAFGAGGNDVDVSGFGVGSATLSGTGLETDALNDITIQVVEVENLLIDGGGEDIDLSLTGTGTEAFVHTPGSSVDAGMVSVGNPGSLLAVTYENLGAGGASQGTLTLDSADSVALLGTSGSDAFDVSWTATDAAAISLTSIVGTHIPIATASVNEVQIDSLDGDDVFDVTGSADFSAGGRLQLIGGSSGNGSDILNFVGGGAAVALDLSVPEIAEAGFAPIGYDGIEQVNLDVNAALAVNGTTGNDLYTVTPLSGDATGNDGTFDHSGSTGVTFNYTDAATITFNGGDGVDSVSLLGDAATDAFTSTADSITVDTSTVTLGTSLEAIEVLGLGGDDTIDLSLLTVSVTIRGGEGNDTITGTGEIDLIFGGAGDDDLVGGGGNDVVYGEAGNDTFGGLAPGAQDPGNDSFFGGDGIDLFVWEPGDGQDVISGGDEAADVFIFRGSVQAGNMFELTADNGHVDAIFGGAVINVAGVETIVIEPADGAASTTTVNDLFTTEVTAVEIDLPAGGNADTIAVAGRNVDDDLIVGPDVAVTGLTYDVLISGSVAGEDTLTLNLGDGNDMADVAIGLSIDTVLNGGDGSDSLSGDFNAANGGAGNDTISGSDSSQDIDAGDGDDTIIISAGDDTVEGGDGFDTLLYQGTNASDVLDLAEAGGVITVSGLIAGTVAPTNVELIDIVGGDGDDSSALTGLTIATRFTGGAGDDTAIATTRNADNTVATTTPAALELIGGTGNDVLIGGSGSDVLDGGEGDDVLEGAQGPDIFLGGADSDYLRWIAGDGSDLMEGGTGDTDQLIFIANDGDNVLQLYGGGLTMANPNGIFPPQTLQNSTRAIFELNDGQVFLNTGDVESVSIVALGGNDDIIINNQVDLFSAGGVPFLTPGTDLGATSVESVEAALGDGLDNIEVHGTASDDNIDAAFQGGLVTVAGLPVLVEIAGATLDDVLFMHGQAGDDNIRAEEGLENTIGLVLAGDGGDDTLNADALLLLGGSGDDTLIGGVGANFILGEDGNDTISGGDGNDDIDAGAGDDTIIISNGLDIVEGGDGFDKLLYQGTDDGDVLDLAEAGGVITVSGLIAGTVAPTNVELIDIVGGDGDDSSALTGLTIATRFTGGAGDDTAIATTRNADNTVATTTPAALELIGGTGNDVLIGGSGSDVLDGGEGDDVLEGAQGPDIFLGGADSDYLRWIAGDGSDLMEGGTGDTDQLIFIANDGDNVLQLYGGGLTMANPNGIFPPQTLQNSTRAIFELNDGQVFLNTGDVESVSIVALGGNDDIIINNQVDPSSAGGVGTITQGTDLGATSVESVEAALGDGLDNIEVHGTAGDDNIDAALQGGLITVEGLPVLVEIAGAVVADTLFMHGQAGDDNIKAEAGLETSIGLVLAGDSGEDTLSADALLLGGPDNDLLIGGAGNDTIFGEGGDDVMIGGAGDDTFDGGEGFDTILIQGTPGQDLIDVFQAAPTTLQYTVNGVTETDTLALQGNGDRTVEEALVIADDGSDIIRVSWLDAHGVNGPTDALRITVEGGSDTATDRLAVVDDGTADLVLYREGVLAGTGTVETGPGNAESLLTVFDGIERVDFLDAAGDPIDNLGDSQLVVFKSDPFEANDDRFNATFLGSGDTINVDPTIDPGPRMLVNPNFELPGDRDFYRVVAEQTGTLDFQVYFRQVGDLASTRPGLPNDGNLDINVLDADGNIIANFGANDADDDERVRIPAVAGETYYLEVFGAGDAINLYNFTILNQAPPVPYDLELNDLLQIGTVNATVAATTTVFSADIAPVNGVLPDPDFDYVGKTVEFTAGANIGRMAVITAFDSATGQFTVDTGLIAAPTVADTFLIETTDTGRSQFDDESRDGTPIITFRLDDDILLRDLPGIPTGSTPPDETIPIPFNALQDAAPVVGAGYRVAIFVEGDPQQPGTSPQTPVGYARPLVGTTGIYVFDFGADAIGGPLVLTDGSHFISAKVEIVDPADEYAFGGRSDSLEVIVDTVFPRVYFGDPAIVGDGLLPSSDSGNPAVPATLTDGITNDTTPTFFGRAEANSIIRAYVDLTNDGFTVDDLLIGQTVATPLDGTNQHPFGEWELTSTVNMNDPRLVQNLGLDGLRTIYVSAEDVAGNISPANLEVLNLVIDTQGPVVTNVQINTPASTYDLFDPKPSVDGPTPSTQSIVISYRDLPIRPVGFPYDAVLDPLASEPGHYTLIGDHSGRIAILEINRIFNDPGPGLATAQYELVVFDAGPDGIVNTDDDRGAPLPDDRFTLTISDSITDPVGNALDGESNAAEPQEDPDFLQDSNNDGLVDGSGDGVPGGDFIARFTIDSRPEIATWSQGVVYADINGNFVWDPEGQDNDATNRDFVFNFGEVTDAYFTGNFAPAGQAASGFDKLGAYGAFNGPYVFLLDTNDDGVADTVGNMAFQVNAIPVAGNFDGIDGDEIGAFDGTFWYLDLDGNNSIDADERFTVDFLPNGIPVVGDFNGDGTDDLATYNNDTGDFSFALIDNYVNAPNLSVLNPAVPDTVNFGFSGFGEKPVIGDINLDGIDDLGMWVPSRAGQLPEDAGEFHFLVSDNPLGALPSQVFEPFSPAPLGNDLQASFGDDFALPLFGNFDPPPSGGGLETEFVSALTNYANRLDTNLDGNVTAADALLVINALPESENFDYSNLLRLAVSMGQRRLDTNSDGVITALDALRVINGLANDQIAESESVSWAAGVDQAIASDDDDDDMLNILAMDQEHSRVK